MLLGRVLLGHLVEVANSGITFSFTFVDISDGRFRVLLVSAQWGLVKGFGNDKIKVALSLLFARNWAPKACPAVAMQKSASFNI